MKPSAIANQLSYFFWDFDRLDRVVLGVMRSHSWKLRL